MTTWAEVEHGHGRNELPWLLEAYAHRLDLDELAKGIECAWTAAEFPMSWIKRDGWRQLFERVGFLEDIRRAERPAEPMTLFRGSVKAKRFGWSWTDDVEQAEWFAERWRQGGHDGRVWTVTVPPEAILAHFPTSRNESEWVIIPTGLKVREIESQGVAVNRPS